MSSSKPTTAKPKKGKGPRVAAVRGIELAKIDEASLTEHLGKLDVRITKGASLEHKLNLYLDWTDALLKTRKEDYGVCDNCDAPCDPDGKSCPVCGKNHESAIEPAVEPAASDAPVQESIDAVVSRIRGLLNESMRNHWQLGRELALCHESKIYKTRLGKNDKPKYRSFDQFAEAELGISGKQARNVMQVAGQFTEVQVVELGVEKLKLISRVPPEAQQDLVKKAKSLSVRELVEQLKGVPGRKSTSSGTPAQVAARSKGVEAASAAAKKRKQQAETGEAITAVFQLSEYELVLNPTTKGFQATDTLANGVVVTYSIITAGKRRYMSVKYERPSK